MALHLGESTMAEYTSYWAPNQGCYSSAAALGRAQTLQMTKLVLTTYDADNQHHWHQQAAPLAELGFQAAPAHWSIGEGRVAMFELAFETVDAQAWPAKGGMQLVLARLAALRERMVAEGLTEVFGPEWGLVPGDFADLRAKTADECQMDVAMLQVEAGDHAQALQSLQLAASSQQSPYWHQVARRAYVNRVHDGGSDDAQADWVAAATHAGQCVALMAPAKQAGLSVYGFGDAYQSLDRQLVAAATTMAEYLLHQADEPEQALAWIEAAESTGHGTSSLCALKVSALLQLGRQPEAFEMHLLWQLAVPEVQTDPAYAAYVQGIEAAQQHAEQVRIAAVRTVYADGVAATPAELAQLQQRFPKLPAAYLQWLAQPQRHSLRVVEDEHEESYTLSSVPAALDNYAALQSWYGGSAYRDEADVAELLARTRQAGFDPQHLLPIVAGVASADYLVIRTDGVDTGKVFIWYHEEQTCLTDLEVQVGDLFPWLEARAKAGKSLGL